MSDVVVHLNYTIEQSMPTIPMGDGGCESAKGRVFCSGGGPGLGISQRPSLLVLEDLDTCTY